MRVRRTPEQDLEDTRAELADAREKAARWNGRVAELEGAVTEKENTLILRAVRSVAASPDELRGLLDMIRGSKTLPGSMETAARKFTPAVESAVVEMEAPVVETPAVEEITEWEIQAETEPPLEQEEFQDEE